MKTCVFVGPSAGDVVLPPEWDRFGPAALGGIWQAVRMGYGRIGLVDGLFGRVPAVWHKEILHALAEGARVYGAASLGALRAAELHPFGMIGAGVIYRAYRAGCLTDDDEVCVAHAPREEGYRPLSLPMVSIRATVASMIRAGDLEASVANAVLTQLKQTHFAERSSGALRAAACHAQLDAGLFQSRFRTRYRDLKAADTSRLVACLQGPAPPRAALDWKQLETIHWHLQFDVEGADIPAVEQW